MTSCVYFHRFNTSRPNLKPVIAEGLHGSVRLSAHLQLIECGQRSAHSEWPLWSIGNSGAWPSTLLSSLAPSKRVKLASERTKRGEKMAAIAELSKFFHKEKTFKPKKKFMPGTLKHSLHKQVPMIVISSSSLTEAIRYSPDYI